MHYFAITPLPFAIMLLNGIAERCRNPYPGPLMLALVWIGLAFPSGARAHQPSESYLTVRVVEARISGQWEAAVRDLDLALGLDGNGDGDVTWGELKEAQADIARFALDGLKIKVNGRRAPGRVTEQRVREHGDGIYVIVRFELENGSRPHFLQIDDNTFFDLDPPHRGLLRLEYEGETQTAIFSAAERSHLFELSRPNRWGEWLAFLWEGIWHIWIGFDHILFLIALLLPAVLERAEGQWRVVEDFRKALWNVVRIVTAFTLAHSMTLGLATFEIVRLPSRWVESVIAASVVLAALHNFFPVLKGKSWVAAFGFGLIHGFGFAGVLRELGLREGTLLLALVGFNLGVEVGQLAIVAAFLPPAYAWRHSWVYRGVILRFGSAAIVMIAGVWMIERMLDLRLLRF